MVGRNSAIAAGVCGALFIGYCIYFDRKRRSDPNFKNRLRERRKKQKLAKERAGLSKLPDLKDAEAVQKFFLEEIQLGEELLAQGEYEKGVDHLTNAIAVCGQPQQLLQVLQQTLPPPVFQMLLTKLPTISQRETKYSGFLRFSFRGIIVAVTENTAVLKKDLWNPTRGWGWRLNQPMAK
ncbi:mitochondrial import receptor subunit TOM20 homolog isoform X3 [Manis pentadactyla]|uniref:mitochondrial import receptor subunit TOM20 homolog isoform X3 n=1 Tax=Manis pentadactyla TaxID=143292 RepID=UPI00255C5587|nr:mitochondrial import receptor subunit TOM20 homolog isoform X3 [Manis pentadactyla]